MQIKELIGLNYYRYFHKNTRPIKTNRKDSEEQGYSISNKNMLSIKIWIN